MHHHPAESLLPRAASNMSQQSSAAPSSVGLEENKIKLRLCYGGGFKQTPNLAYKYVGGEYFNESIPYGIKYADFMFKLSEKFKTAVSVKYQAPGEELDPDSLISVQDDADLQELVEDYYAHLQRPGTPSKTFRIKVFVQMAAEEPLTPDEIMDGQSFFSESHALPARVTAFRGLDGRSSWGSTLSSTGTPCTRQQDVSTGDWLSSIAGQHHQPVALPGDLAADLQLQRSTQAGDAAVMLYHPLNAALEQEALDRVRMSVSSHTGMQRLATQHSGLLEGEGEVDESFPNEEEDEEEHIDDDYDEDEEGDKTGDEDDQQLAEVLAAIEQQRLAASLAPPAVVPPPSASASMPPASETSLPADPWDMSDDVAGQPAGEDRVTPALPSHISAFGEEHGSHEIANAAGDAGFPAPPTEVTAATVAPQLPSHISAFGDDLGSNTAGGCAVLGGSGDLQAEEAANGNGAIGSRLAAGYGGLRTQDSGFSLDGEAAAGQCAADGQQCKPDRAGSGDSLTSIPKLQPVHRLAKPDLKIVAKIGEGAFGEVSVANAPLYGTVAVKWLKSERFGKHFASFGREAALLADLNHPNVLRFYGVVTESASDNTVIGIMTEYIRGGSMSAFLRMSQAPLPLRTRCELALGASNGLAYLHELRIVHFDLKPDNLLLDAPLAVVRAAAGATLDECPSSGKAGTLSPVSSSAAYPCDEDEYLLGGPHQLSGHWPAGAAAVGVVRPAASNSSTAQAVGGAGAAARGRIGRRSSGPDRAAAAAAFDELCEVPVVKVADFGLSKHKLNSTYVSSCRDLRGTLPYMAPELVADPERVCEKADVWSLGVVMWEMLTREIPFQNLAPQQILMGLMCGNLHLDVPEWCEPEWRGLLEACLEPNPSNRPSMRELSKQLEAIKEQQLAQEQQQVQLPVAQHAPQQQQLQQQQQQQQQQRQPCPTPPPAQQQERQDGLSFSQLDHLQQPQHVVQQDEPSAAPLGEQRQLRAAHADLQQQVAAQAGRMYQLESALAHQDMRMQFWMNQQTAIQLQAHSAGVAAVVPHPATSGHQQQQQQQGCALHHKHQPASCGYEFLQPT